MRVASDAEVETDLGYSVGLIFGRRWGNLVGEIHFGHYVNIFSSNFWILSRRKAI